MDVVKTYNESLFDDEEKNGRITPRKTQSAVAGNQQPPGNGNRRKGSSSSSTEDW